MFGGKLQNDDLSDLIAEFDEKTKKWSHLGNLHQPRSNHRVIHDGISFCVIGGHLVKDYQQVVDRYLLDYPSERCVVDHTSESMSCIDYASNGLYLRLSTYYPNPALFLIDQTYYE